MTIEDLATYKKALETQQRQLAPGRVDLEAIEIQRSQPPSTTIKPAEHGGKWFDALNAR